MSSTYPFKGGYNYAIMAVEEADFRITKRVFIQEIEEEELAGILCLLL